ncbi:MAG: hypothetical protein KatS3mg051_2306 [Anaerolineae bacterium]|nr:MAG: hypothetical protein KatS3mg051_2214 [Anaerolineae bacterium]GIV82952.1 MAG: hypothetical protein KatS3mg051_2306 [Anaerolineae bacterium]
MDITIDDVVRGCDCRLLAPWIPGQTEPQYIRSILCPVHGDIVPQPLTPEAEQALRDLLERWRRDARL